MRLWFVLLVVCAVCAQAQVSCLVDPSQASCANYVYPAANATADNTANCGMMPYMTSCTIADVCAARINDGFDDDTTQVYCNSFSILADGCIEMAGMSPCKNYVSLCSPSNSTVQQCTNYPPIPGLPTTEQANTAIKAICTSHSMPGCDECPIGSTGFMNCDLLKVYSNLCLQMPDMAECSYWTAMCQTLDEWELCPSSNPNYAQPPMMRMYFHADIADYILFYSWVPRTNGQYIGAIIGIFIFAVLFEGLQSFRAMMERKWAAAASTVNTINTNGVISLPEAEDSTLLKNAATTATDNGLVTFVPQPFRLGVDLQRSTLHLIEIAAGYALMLIVMTFNVGLVVAVLSGLFFGMLAFGRFRTYVAKAACC